jgi:hypothetical protein
MAANPFATYLERFLANTGHAAAPTLENSINYIASGARQASKDPAMLAASHGAARENLNKIFMVELKNGKNVNLAPNSPRIHVETPDGRYLEFPKSAQKEAEKAGKVLNFTPKQIEEALPPAPAAPPKPAPAPTKDTSESVAAAIEKDAARVQAERDVANLAAQREAEQARIAAASQSARAEAEARGFQDARNKIEAEGRAFPAASADAPTVQLAKDTVSAPRAVPTSEAASAAVAPEVSGNPFADRINAAMQPKGAQIPSSVEQAASQPRSASVPSAGIPPEPSIPRGPWNPRPTPVAPSDPLKSKFPLSTELSLWAAPPAALAYGALMAPSKEEVLQKKMLAAVQAGQPSEDMNPSENDIQAALRIAKQRAEESAAKSARVQGMQDQDEQELEADRAMRAQIPAGYQGSAEFTLPRRQIPASDYDSIQGLPIAGGEARRPTGAGSTAPAKNNSLPGSSDNDLRSIPQPMRRLGALPPATDEGNQSFFSSLLSKLTPKDPYAGMSAQQMYERAQEMQSSGDEGGSNVLIQRAGRLPDAGMKRGGVATAGGAGPHKDAALHKALDIIHAMMTRGR